MKHILFLLFCLLGVTIQAQSLAQARALYKEGNYEKAKPVFKKLVKSSPGNGNYHLWYGVCCLHTGEPQQAIKHLETAVKRRVPSGQFYLGQAYNQVYRFEEAIEIYEDYIDDLTKRKRSTQEVENLLLQSKLGLRLLRGVEEVCFIDSMVVDKATFLKNYKISPECGKLYTYDEYFHHDTLSEGTVYETQLGNKLFYAELQPDSTLSILSSNKMQDTWGKGHLLPGDINEAMNANYPYVMTDGITIYYAADGPQSIGGYDIFVTRYNTNNDSYLTPQNIGMPFNSPANDYMYVIDEYNNLGWFASDRNQPADKVCLYIFIPNPTKQVYDYDNTEAALLRRLATLHSLSETWKDEAIVTQAKQRLQHIEVAQPTQQKRYDFTFVIDDQRTYHQLSDFKSPAALDAFKQYRQLEKSCQQRQEQLNNLRTDYQQADETGRQTLVPGILDLETRMEQLVQETQRAAILVRQLEKQNSK